VGRFAAGESPPPLYELFRFDEATVVHLPQGRLKDTTAVRLIYRIQ